MGPLSRLSLLCLVSAIAIASNVTYGSNVAEAEVVSERLPGIPMELSPAAKQALQQSDKAFPSDDAGFSAYYRVEEDGSFSLEKDTVDNYIFSPLPDGGTALRATLVEIGENYTVATLTLLNIDSLESTVNLYYDDEGWIVAYLSRGESSALVWQANSADPVDPNMVEIGDTLLLEAINVVVDGGLGKTAIEDGDSGLGHYHWQFPNADNFLMMAVSREYQGEYPVQFAVPDSLTLLEVSASLWISQGEYPLAPCAKVTLDGTDLIPKQCLKGIYGNISDLINFEDTSIHTWKLIQSMRDEGGSGSLMMIIYETSG